MQEKYTRECGRMSGGWCIQYSYTSGAKCHQRVRRAAVLLNVSTLSGWCHLIRDYALQSIMQC